MPHPIPAKYLDPITNQIMRNPVKVDACGHILDKGTVVEKVLMMGLKMCPCRGCNKPIGRPPELPALKREIDAFLRANPQLANPPAKAPAEEPSPYKTGGISAFKFI